MEAQFFPHVFTPDETIAAIDLIYWKAHLL